VLYIVSELFAVLLVLCFMSLVSFTGFYTKDEPISVVHVPSKSEPINNQYFSVNWIMLECIKFDVHSLWSLFHLSLRHIVMRHLISVDLYKCWHCNQLNCRKLCSLYIIILFLFFICLGRWWDFKYQWIVHCGINSWRGSQHLEVSEKSSCES